ncbi:outer membrane beta-barrel protein [Bremerella sp. JC817]|uniref:outer membrane beta-barrel protein n=1 Tax=Bremerella sp. JC817 TaxID=3231756 RepID=UPI00345B14DC
MLRRLTTASLAIGLLAGLTTTSLPAQELVGTEMTQAGWEIHPTHFEEASANEMAAAQAIDMQMVDYATCDTGCENTFWNRCCGGDWFLDGWLDQGYTANADHPANNFNSPMGFNDRADDYQLNQLYLAFGKNIDEDCCGWDFGFRTDLLFGSDYFFVESNGLERERNGDRKWNGSGPRQAGTRALNGLAMPQLYAETFIPVGSGLKAKFGHFYSILGYETTPAPENFFYSHSYTYVYGNPKTHTGFLSEYSPTTCLTLQAGMTNGWDNFENINGAYGFLFGANWNNGVSGLSFAMHTGSEDPTGKQNRYSHTILYTRKLSSRWNFALEHDFGVQNDAFLTSTFTEEDAFYYSFVNYLYYQWSDTLSFGGRLEWFRDEDNWRILQVPIETAFTGGNYYNATLGANWKPCDHVLVRPEARYDWSDLNPTGQNGVFNDFDKDDQYTFAVDVILFF